MKYLAIFLNFLTELDPLFKWVVANAELLTEYIAPIIAMFI